MNISVTIPTLNEVDNIEECLSLIKPQMNSGDEIVVIDGGSTDGTREVAKDMGAVVITAEDAGIGLSRHIGVLESKNPIIATTDADARPPSDWLGTIREHFMDDELVVLWGNIEDKNGYPIRNLTGKFSTLTGGASGNNTAFRRETYMEHTDGYPDMDYAEDAFMIYRLAFVGKAVRDKDMVMVMDMDRTRYQTVPIIGTSALLVAAGSIWDGKLASISKGLGLGLGATEVLYEEATGTPFHHDEVGLAVLGAGATSNSPLMIGAGSGMALHHAITEGISMLPTTLQRETDIILEGENT